MNEKAKITIPKEEIQIGEKQFTNKYGVHRATYYRLKKNSHDNNEITINKGYHSKEQTKPDTDWVTANCKKISENAKIGARYALKTLGGKTKRRGFLEDNFMNDFEQESILRIIELSGKKEHRDSKKWQIVVAKNATLSYIGKLRKHSTKEAPGFLLRYKKDGTNDFEKIEKKEDETNLKRKEKIERVFKQIMGKKYPKNWDIDGTIEEVENIRDIIIHNRCNSSEKKQRGADIFLQKTGLLDGVPKSFRQISKQYKITPARVGQLYKRNIKYLIWSSLRGILPKQLKEIDKK